MAGRGIGGRRRPNEPPRRADSAAISIKARDNPNRPPKAPHGRTWRAVRGRVRSTITSCGEARVESAVSAQEGLPMIALNLLHHGIFLR